MDFYKFWIFRFGVFKVMPLVTEMIFRQAREGILLIDSNDRVIYANDAFINFYPELGRLSRHTTLTSFIASHPEFQNALKRKDRSRFLYPGGDKERYFSVEINKVIIEDRLQIGTILKITDITTFVEHERRLQSIASAAIDQAETNEISFLQAQISPHFINNTLSVIASMITRAPDEAKLLITNLGNYLMERYYFDHESAMVTLDKELETVEMYISIEKARFGERLGFQFVCDQVPQIDVPRLLLQPLVENAVRHGILKKAGGGNVWLKIYCGEDRICFEIQDDGVGIPEEKIETLTKTSNKQGIGIMNIQRRLLKYYGEGLLISSRLGAGTSVVFTVPIQAEKMSI